MATAQSNWKQSRERSLKFESKVIVILRHAKASWQCEIHRLRKNVSISKFCLNFTASCYGTLHITQLFKGAVDQQTWFLTYCTSSGFFPMHTFCTFSAQVLGHLSLRPNTNEVKSISCLSQNNTRITSDAVIPITCFWWTEKVVPMKNCVQSGWTDSLVIKGRGSTFQV